MGKRPAGRRMPRAQNRPHCQCLGCQRPCRYRPSREVPECSAGFIASSVSRRWPWPVSVARAADAPPAQARPNVLFIPIDDLRDWVHYLGTNAQVQTPHLDRLAARGVSFTRSYCAAPVCNPSRTALLTGLRPWTSGVYDNETEWRDTVPVSATTLPAAIPEPGLLCRRRRQDLSRQPHPPQ